jgi:hypothetical protein
MMVATGSRLHSRRPVRSTPLIAAVKGMFMTKRLLGAALLTLLLVTSMAPLAAATEETGATEGAAHEPMPEMDEVVTVEARSEGFVPEEYVSPSWFQWLLYPSIIIGVIMVIGLLLYYLARQPAFAEERRQKSRR